MRALWWTVAGPAIVLGSFFGALYAIDRYSIYYTGAELRDRQRATDAATLKSALGKYRAAKGAYPIFADNSTDDLKAALVDGGYLPDVPRDPLPPRTYRYVSPEGARYGLWFQLEAATGTIPAGGICLTGVKFAGTGWYNQPPECPF